MQAEIKILHIQEKTAKNGEKYKIIHALIKIDSVEWVRTFFLWIK